MCPKCSSIINSEDKYCKNCGYSYEFKEEIDFLDVNPPENYNIVLYNNEDDLIKSFIGPNADKILSKKWNWAAFFLSYWYLLYRKMWIHGIIMILVTGLISSIIFMFASVVALGTFSSTISYIIYFGLNLIIAFNFNTIYLKYVKKRVNIIKEKTTNDSNENLLDLCRKKGGVAKWVIVIFIISLILPTIIKIIFSAVRISEIKKDINHSTYCAIAYDCNEDFTNCKYRDNDGKEIDNLDCSSIFDY